MGRWEEYQQQQARMENLIKNKEIIYIWESIKFKKVSDVKIWVMF